MQPFDSAPHIHKIVYMLLEQAEHGSVSVSVVVVMSFILSVSKATAHTVGKPPHPAVTLALSGYSQTPRATIAVRRFDSAV